MVDSWKIEEALTTLPIGGKKLLNWDVIPSYILY